MGAQIVGGCCATTPDHIAALAPVVRGAGEAAS
jgi:methionine synthase I (cobalamin-dependent)